MPHKYKEVVAAYGAGFGAKVASLLFAEADQMVGTYKNAPYMQIRTIGNAVIGVGAAVLAGSKGAKMSEPAFDAVLGAGVVAATELVDPLETLILGKQLTYSSPIPVPVSQRYEISGVQAAVPPPKASRSFS